MTSNSTSAASKPDQSRLPSELFRTCASLLIFVHLFCMALCFATGTDSGAAQLLATIKTNTPLMENYLVQFWLDHGYDYHLMNDQPSGLDWNHQLNATINFDDGRTEKVAIPPADLWPGDRRERYQRLAWYVGWYVDRAASEVVSPLDSERKSILPASIGGGLIKQREGAKSVDIGCVFHQGISRDQLRSKTPGENDPNSPRYFVSLPSSNSPNPTPYRVLVKVDPLGRPVTFESLPVGETSPVRKSGDSKKSKATSAAGQSAEAKANEQ